jgi:hypothetical protein
MTMVIIFWGHKSFGKHCDSRRQVKHEMPRGTAVTKVSGQGAMTPRAPQRQD